MGKCSHFWGKWATFALPNDANARMSDTARGFLHISISPTRPFEGLGGLLRLHLEGGVERVHLRFPGLGLESYRGVLEEMGVVGPNLGGGREREVLINPADEEDW